MSGRNGDSGWPRRTRSVWIIAALALFAVAAGYVVLSFKQQDRFNVILVTVESLRDDQVTRETTPNLIDAARSGYRFTHHRAVSGWTGSNIVSLLTGLSPFDTGVHTRGQSVDPDRRLALEVLVESGYRVEGIQGFMQMDIYRDLGLTVHPEAGDLRYWLGRKAQAREPFFTWYHYVDTHLPYDAVAGYESATAAALSAGRLPDALADRLELVRTRAAIHHDEATFLPADGAFIRDLHAGTIREFDDWFALLWDFFHDSGLQRRTILVVTADHGDEYGERGMVGHASTTVEGHLHEEIVRVPLFVWLPEPLRQKNLEPDTALISTHEDVLPTIFDFLGAADRPGDLPGRNLFFSEQPSVWFGMTSSGGFAEPDPERIRYFDYATLAWPWKLVVRTDHQAAETVVLHNLAADPAESENFLAAHPAVADDLYRHLSARILARTVQPADSGERPAADDQAGSGPVWLQPAAGGAMSYDDLDGSFRLAWSGAEDGDFILEYRAGAGDHQLEGSLEVTGNVKDFGYISRRYWNTWIVPNSPFRLRVRAAGSDLWSAWLDLEARP